MEFRNQFKARGSDSLHAWRVKCREIKSVCSQNHQLHEKWSWEKAYGCKFVYTSDTFVPTTQPQVTTSLHHASHTPLLPSVSRKSDTDPQKQHSQNSFLYDTWNSRFQRQRIKPRTRKISQGLRKNWRVFITLLGN